MKTERLLGEDTITRIVNAALGNKILAQPNTGSYSVAELAPLDDPYELSYKELKRLKRKERTLRVIHNDYS